MIDQDKKKHIIKMRYYYLDITNLETGIRVEEYEIHEIESLKIEGYFHRSLFTGQYDKYGTEIYYDDVLSTSNSSPDYDIWDKLAYGLIAVNPDWEKFGWFPESDPDSIFNYKFVTVEGNLIQGDYFNKLEYQNGGEELYNDLKLKLQANGVLDRPILCPGLKSTTAKNLLKRHPTKEK